jgi:hypothetical protein
MLIGAQASVNTTSKAEYMNDARARVRSSSILILEEGPPDHMNADKPILWELGRRNYALRADVVLSIVCSSLDESE